MSVTELHFLKGKIKEDVHDPSQIVDVEREDLFRLKAKVGNKTLRKITNDLLTDLKQTFGNSITLDLGRATRSPVLGQGTIDDDFSETVTDLQKKDRPTEIQVEVEKDALASHLDVKSSDHRTVIYLHKENAQVQIDGLRKFEEKLYTDQYTPVLLLVFGSGACHTGPLLNVTDIDTISSVEAEIQPPTRRMKERIDQYRERVGTELNWTGFDLDFVTPIHLMCSPLTETSDGEVSEFGRSIRRMLFHTCILYTSDRTELNDSIFASTYAASEGTAQVELASTIDSLEDSDLVRFARWPCLTMANDRLDVLRTVMVRELRSTSGTNYTTLADNLGPVLREVRWHYRIFVSERIEEHFAQVKEVTDYVSSTTKRINDWVDSMTSSLVNTLLATLGLVVVTLLSSLVDKSGLPPSLIEDGLFLYACYILVFPGVYRMSNMWHSYSLLKQEFADRKEQFEARLGKEKVSEQMSTISARKSQFSTWFFITAVLYLGVVIGLFALSDNVESLLP